MHPAQAIILSGGGAYAAYEVGILKGLTAGQVPCTRGVPEISIISGTSAGAYNACFLVSRYQREWLSATQELEQIWRNRIAGDNCENGVYRLRANPAEFLNPNCFLRDPARMLANLGQDGIFLAQDWGRRAVLFAADQKHSLQDRLVALVDLSSFFVMQPLVRLIRETVELPKIRNSSIKLMIAATNWGTGDLEIIDNQRMSDELGHLFIAASAAVPGFFPAISIHNDPWVDGGVLLNTPLEPALRLGATTVHMVYMDPDLKYVPNSTLLNTIETFDRMLTVTVAGRINAAIAATRRINRGLIAISQALHNEPENRKLELLKLAGFTRSDGTPLQLVTIHRYHPREELGSLLGLLNFEHRHIDMLIDKGYDDAIHHDCAQSGCVLAEEP